MLSRQAPSLPDRYIFERDTKPLRVVVVYVVVVVLFIPLVDFIRNVLHHTVVLFIPPCLSAKFLKKREEILKKK
jgi:ABC-type bacteriocin/lantibiotic exporter with double-glycine peptidase domain